MNRMITLCALFVFFVLMPQIAWPQETTAPDGSNYQIFDMNKGDTVGGWALKITRNANNWASDKILVVNSRTNAVYPKNQYRRLPAGIAQVWIPKDMVKTTTITLANESIEKLCAEKIDLNTVSPIASGRTRQEQCLYSLTKINSIPDPKTALTAGIYIPLDWKQKPVTPPVDVCQNIEGVQSTIPFGLVKDVDGNCVNPPPPPPPWWQRNLSLIIIIILMILIAAGVVGTALRQRRRANRSNDFLRRRPPA